MICTYAILLFCFKQEKKKAGVGVEDDDEEEEVVAYLSGADEEFDPSTLPDPDKMRISEDENEER